MNKKLFLFVGLFLLFSLSYASAHHYSDIRYNLDNINKIAEDRVAHNKVYDYFKYGSYFQHNGYYPIYRDLSYSDNYFYPRGNRISIRNHLHHNDYGGTNIKIYSGYDRPIGRIHSSDRTYVLNCGYSDGFYRDCY